MRRFAILVLLFAACGDKPTATKPGVATGPLPVLRVRRLPADQRVMVDGTSGDPYWAKADETVVPLTGGSVSEVRLKALWDGEFIYMLAIWKDPERSMNRYWTDRGGLKFDLSKTEDAFSICWAPGSAGDAFRQQGCALFCHDGRHVFRGEGRAVADFWKFGAQTSAVHGQAIDMRLQQGDKERLRGDDQPKNSGNILNHSPEFEGPGYYPKYMSKNVNRILLHTNARPITMAQKRDKLSDPRNIGREIPLDVLRKHGGSRGDVVARARHFPGKAWILELSRALDTGQMDDLSLGDPLIPFYFAVAVHQDAAGADHGMSGPIELRFLMPK